MPLAAVRALWLCVLLALPSGSLLSPTPSAGQALTREDLSQLRRTVADRVETMVLLGGDSGVSGGAYSFRTETNIDLDLTKIGGSGSLMAPRPIGGSGVAWSPVLLGNLGFLEADNTIQHGTIAGNLSRTNTRAIELGSGARFYFGRSVSVAPKLALIYARTTNEFLPRNAAGSTFASRFSGLLVDWHLNSMTLVPSIDVMVDWQMGRTHFEFVSDFHTYWLWTFGESSPVVDFDGASQVWLNSIDVDVPLGVKILGRELRSGGYFSRAELFGDIEEALRTSHIHTINGRLVVDLTDRVWKTSWLGFGGSYFWGPDFTGWSAGVDIKMNF